MEHENLNITLNINLMKSQNFHFGRSYILSKMAFLLEHSFCNFRVERDGKKYLKNIKTYFAPELEKNNTKVTVWRMYRDLVQNGYIERIEEGTDILYTLTDKTWSIKNSEVS